MNSTEKEKEINSLIKYPLIELIQYIKNGIDIIISNKLKEELEAINQKSNILSPARDYELLLQKEEKKSRELLSIEHRLRLQCERYVEEIDILDTENRILLLQIIIIYFKI